MEKAAAVAAEKAIAAVVITAAIPAVNNLTAGLH